MWWFILLAIAAIIVYFIYSRNTAKNTFPKEQLGLMRNLVEDKIEQLKVEKQQVIDQAAKEGKTIPLESITKGIEELKEKYKGDEKSIAEIDYQINKLKDKYGTNIPVDEAYKLVTEYEDEFGSL